MIIRSLCTCWALVATSALLAQDFEDDFERADGPVEGWISTLGTWEIVDGTLVTTANGGENWAWAGDPAFAVEGDMSAEFNLQFGPAPGDGVGRHGGVMIFGSTPTHRGDGAISGYLIDWIDRVDDHGLRVIRYDNGAANFLQLGTPDLVEPPVTWRIEVEGDIIRIIADDSLAIEVVDATHRSGFFGAWAFGNGTQLALDNVFLEYTPQLVNACFDTSTVVGAAPLTVDFDASCSTAAAELVNYSWDFGDGTRDEGAQISHVFEFDDTYVVTLTIEDIDGNSASTEATVTALAPAEDFFDDFSQDNGPPLDWTVVSGDWQIVDETLVVTAVGEEGWIFAGDPPVALPLTCELVFDTEYLGVPADGVGRHAGVMFCATEAGRRWAPTQSGYELDWIDRASDHGLRLLRVDNGTHTLLGQGGRDLPDPPTNSRIVVGPGSIEVWGDDERLIAVNDATHRGGIFGFWAYSNSQRVAYDNVQVLSADLIACFTSDPVTPFPLGTDVTFDAGCSAGDIVSWEWTFSDGGSASGEVVEHTFAEPGVHDVTLTVETSNGETESSSESVTAFEVAECFDDELDRADGPPSGWTIVSGDWRIENEALHIATPVGSPESWAWAGEPSKRFGTINSISFRLEFLETPFDAVGRHGGVFFCAQNELPRFSGNSGYSIDWIDRVAGQGYRISVWNNGVETSLVAGTGDIEPGEIWTVEIDDDTIRLIVDEVVKAEVLDATWRGGHVGFWSYFNDQNLEIDDIVVNEPCDSVDPAPRPRFKRGDADASGDLQLTDGVTIFAFLFLGDDAPSCFESADPDNDGIINLTDGILVLNFLFLGGPPPAPPLDCGEDTDPVDSPRDLGCESYPSCG